MSSASSAQRDALVNALLLAQSDEEVAGAVGALVQLNNPGRPGLGPVVAAAVAGALGSPVGPGVLGAVGRLFGRLFSR